MQQITDIEDFETDSEGDSDDGTNEKSINLVSSPADEVENQEEEEVEVKETVDSEEVARRIKEQFRSSMARVMVQHLNPYRHSDAPAGRITCTADFKHLARKVYQRLLNYML